MCKMGIMIVFLLLVCKHPEEERHVGLCREGCYSCDDENCNLIPALLHKASRGTQQEERTSRERIVFSIICSLVKKKGFEMPKSMFM